MKIARVAVKDFGPFEDVEVLFDQPLSVVRADNASGKSKLSQAIQLSLTCQSAGTDPRGAGAMDKVRLGAEKAIIETGLETAKGPMMLVTQYGPGKAGRSQRVIAGSGGDDTQNLSKGFAGFLEASKERLSCVLDAEYFINEKPADQKAILAALVLPSHYDFDPKMIELVEKHIGKIDWKRNPVAIIDEVYGDNRSGVYSARTQAKSTLAGIYIPPKPAKPEFTAEEVQSKLTDLRAKQVKEAKKVKGGGTVQVGRVEQSLEQEKERLAQATADRKAAHNKKVCIEADLLDGPTLIHYKQLAAKRKDYEELSQQIADLEAEIAAQAHSQNLFSAMLQDKSGKPLDHASCPTCTQTISRSFITAKVEEHGKVAREAEAEKARLERRQKELGDFAGAEAALKQHETKTAEKLVAVKEFTANSERIGFIETAIKDLEKALTDARAAQGAPADTSALDALNTEIGEWEGRLAPAVQYDSTLKQIAETETRHLEQSKKVSELELLCNYFGKDGVKAKLIAEHIGTFTETVNSVLEVWGYKANLSIEPYSFEVLVPDKPGYLPLKELSGFERLAFGVALQSAIAVHSKLRVILVDRADTMIDSQRNKLLGCIKLMLDNETLDQAIVMLADKSKTAPKKPGCTFYFVENGKVDRL